MEGFYTTKVLCEKEISEIDMDLYSEFFGNNWDDKYSRLVEIGDFRGNEAMSLDKMINQLIEFKDAGCTHVSIDYHVDHIGYELSGLSIALSTRDEKKAYKEKEKEKSILEKKIEKLDKDREKLVKEYKKIK